MEPAELKSELRARIWSARLALSNRDRQTAGLGIADHGLAWALGAVPEGGTLTAYLGVGPEPPTLGLLERLHTHDRRVLLPICLPERQLGWTEWRPGIEFARSRFAPVQEPVGTVLGTAEIVAGSGLPPIAAILLPATALDAEGRRLGQGGGYYDRFLARLDGLGLRPPTAAVVYDDELLASGSVPDEPLDRRVEAAVTPRGLIRLGPQRAAE